MSKPARAFSPEKPQKRIDEHPGILIGKHPTKNTFLASYGQTFVMLAAPPSSGKTVGVVTPNFRSARAPHAANFENIRCSYSRRNYHYRYVVFCDYQVELQ